QEQVVRGQRGHERRVEVEHVGLGVAREVGLDLGLELVGLRLVGHLDIRENLVEPRQGIGIDLLLARVAPARHAQRRAVLGLDLCHIATAAGGRASNPGRLATGGRGSRGRRGRLAASRGGGRGRGSRLGGRRGRGCRGGLGRRGGGRRGRGRAASCRRRGRRCGRAATTTRREHRNDQRQQQDENAYALIR